MIKYYSKRSGGGTATVTEDMPLSPSLTVTCTKLHTLEPGDKGLLFPALRGQTAIIRGFM